MTYTEELLWILDKTRSTLQNSDEKIKENIEFVHSLGLKCDSVGWCKLKLSSPKADEILEKIAHFCNENGWRTRGIYTRTYTNVESDWYELLPAYLNYNTPTDRIETRSEDGEIIFTRIIRAYHERTAAPKMWGDEIYLPERFRNACVRNNLHNLDFCWAKDKGKYAAEQYFHAYGKHLIPHIGVSLQFDKTDQAKIEAAGGWLPKIASIFDRLQEINLPDCYLFTDMPKGGIAYAHIPTTVTCCGRNSILIHKDIVEMLVREKAISATSLRHVPVLDTLLGGYSLQETQPISRPTIAFMNQMLSEYEKLKATPRPVRMASEQDALKALRKAKRDRKEDFQKKLSNTEQLTEAYRVLAPYYLVANGGNLSDEYELLSYHSAVEANTSFFDILRAEEQLEEKPNGVVFAKCPDGDFILLCTDGTVIQFSHEVPEVTNQWLSLAQFMFDSITENE